MSEKLAYKEYCSRPSSISVSSIKVAPEIHSNTSRASSTTQLYKSGDAPPPNGATYMDAQDPISEYCSSKTSSFMVPAPSNNDSEESSTTELYKSGSSDVDQAYISNDQQVVKNCSYSTASFDAPSQPLSDAPPVSLVDAKRQSAFESDQILARMLSNRQFMMDVEPEHEAERQKRMYNMLRHSKSYRKLQVESANNKWDEMVANIDVDSIHGFLPLLDTLGIQEHGGYAGERTDTSEESNTHSNASQLDQTHSEHHVPMETEFSNSGLYCSSGSQRGFDPYNPASIYMSSPERPSILRTSSVRDASPPSRSQDSDYARRNRRVSFSTNVDIIAKRIACETGGGTAYKPISVFSPAHSSTVPGAVRPSISRFVDPSHRPELDSDLTLSSSRSSLLANALTTSNSLPDKDSPKSLSKLESNSHARSSWKSSVKRFLRASIERLTHGKAK